MNTQATDRNGRTDGKGLECRVCGCRHFYKVRKSVLGDDCRYRELKCRHCGASRWTKEA